MTDMPTTVIAFDVFGTVFDLSGVDKAEVREYLEFIQKFNGAGCEWRPLNLPESWEHLPAHWDSAGGLERLRKKYFVVTCSNGPLGLLAKLSKNAGIQWDAIIPLEMNKVYKPYMRAYHTVCEVLEVMPESVLMVTANEKFGDIEAARKAGMESQLIRNPGCPQTIIELAERLGC